MPDRPRVIYLVVLWWLAFCINAVMLLEHLDRQQHGKAIPILISTIGWSALGGIIALIQLRRVMVWLFVACLACWSIWLFYINAVRLSLGSQTIGQAAFAVVILMINVATARYLLSVGFRQRVALFRSERDATAIRRQAERTLKKR